MYGRFGALSHITPVEFEQLVRDHMESLRSDLNEFQAKHNELVTGADGSYAIDVTVRFKVLDVNFVVLVECKHQKNPIKREIVQILSDKLRSTGAHKGIIFATTTFQRGAIDYAEAHGISLIQVADGRFLYETRSHVKVAEVPSWVNLPKYATWEIKGAPNGAVVFTLVDNVTDYISFKEKLSDWR